MASVTRRAGLALLLCAVLLAPVVPASQPRQASAQPLPGVIAAPCVSGPQAAICAALVAAAAGLWVYNDLSSDESTLVAVGQAIADWWNGESDETRAALSSLVYGGYVDLTPYAIAQLNEALASLTTAGWEQVTFNNPTTGDTWVQLSDLDVSALGHTTTVQSFWMDVSPGAMPGCTEGSQHNVTVRIGAPAGTTGTFSYQLFHADRVTSYGGSSQFTVNALASGTPDLQAPTPKATSSSCAALAAQGLSIFMQIRTAGSGTDWQSAGWLLGPVSWRSQTSGGTFTHYPVAYEVTMAEAAGTLTMPGWAGDKVTVRIPANPDDLIGTSGNPAVPLASGGVGQVVADAPATAGESLVDSENAGWWEGLFGGVQGALQSIWGRLTDVWNRLGDMAGTLTNILTAIQSLVSDLIAAIEGVLVDLFVPTVDPFAGLSATVAGAVPACVVSGFGGALSGIFTGGASAVSIPVGPYGNITISDANGWVAPLRTLSSYVAYVGLIGYAVALYRRFFGGGGGS